LGCKIIKITRDNYEDVSPRERVLTTLLHREPDKVPKYIRFTPEVKCFLRDEMGIDNYEDYFGIEIRRVGFKPAREVPDFAKYYTNLPPDTEFDDWGIPFVAGSQGHLKRELYPLAKFKSPKEVSEYPWPDFMVPYRHEYLEREVKELHDRGYAVMGRLTEISGGFIFETAWQLRGMHNLLVDFYDNPELARLILDKILDINSKVSRRFAEAGVDILWLGDDVGMQETMFMSPDMWRTWLKPRLKQMIKSAKDVNPMLHIFYHSDGFIEPIIPDLIEIGVDILNPIQPECMDPIKLKKLYVESLSFFGTISVQTTMPFGTPEDVRQKVKQMIEGVGKEGGFIISPTHYIQIDVPWENVLAFFQAVDEFGKYQ